MCALHHRQKKEMQEVLAALQASYAETRAKAAASYRLMVGEWWLGQGFAWIDVRPAQKRARTA